MPRKYRSYQLEQSLVYHIINRGVIRLQKLETFHEISKRYQSHRTTAKNKTCFKKAEKLLPKYLMIIWYPMKVKQLSTGCYGTNNQ